MDFQFINSVPTAPEFQSRFREKRRYNFKYLIVKDTFNNVTLQQYFDYFSKLATINGVTSEGVPGTVKVEFRQVPSLLDRNKFIGPHIINDTYVHASFQTNADKFIKFEITRLIAHKLSFGFFKEQNQFIEAWSTTEGAKFNICYTSKTIDIFFDHLDFEYKLTYKFKETNGDMLVETAGSVTIFTIPLRHTPRISRYDQRKIVNTNDGVYSTGWERATAIPLSRHFTAEPRDTFPLSPNNPLGYFNLPQWTVLRLEFLPQSTLVFESELNKTIAYNIIPKNYKKRKPFITVTDLQELRLPISYKDRLSLDFDVLYALESAVSNYFLNDYNMDSLFYQAIKALDVDQVREYLEMVVLRKTRIWDPLSDLSEQTKIIRSTRKTPAGCFLVHKVIVSPSGLFIEPQNLEVGNRVIRHFKNNLDQFLRVQFLDEGFHQIGCDRNFGPSIHTALYTRVRDLLDNGIQISGKHYECLAYSSSQLREHGCWFFASTKELSADMIRSWMGNFSKEKVVAKHAARMGQCFSSSIAACRLEKSQIEIIPDVERNNRVFSDGVGTMSLTLANKVRNKMNLQTDPSALQVRIGGAKGVLVVDNRLRNTQIRLRPSQIKFESDHLDLEVVKVATYRNGHLNRQVIVLLSALGVDDNNIMNLVLEMLKMTESILTDPMEALYALSPHRDEFGTSEMLMSAIQAGFLKDGDPYIKNILTLFRCSLLKELKKKAKVLVPDSACLIGVMDETGRLEHDQVFLQVWDNSIQGNIRKVVTGPVAVFRNPSLHPGDIRVLNAVDIPELQHLKNVVVFSSKGERDIPSMCSGGDLDGDEYIIIWDPKLIPPSVYSPMNYHAEEPERKIEVSMMDVKDSFVEYIRHDTLGQIANAYLVNADLYSPMDVLCIELAQLHSRAVDFAKTGRRAIMPKHLLPKSYPDFMQKKHNVGYESKKILGRIFRQVDSASYKNYQTYLTEDAPTYDDRFYVNGMVSYVKKARELRKEYDFNLTALMNQYGMLTETELLSGYFVKWQKKGKGRTVYKQHENILRSIKQFKAKWKEEFEREFLDENNMIDLSKRKDMYAKASAWYYVTYNPVERREYQIDYFSFPWTVYKYLCSIKQDEDVLSKTVASLKI